jgi:hypothetical protein
MQATEAVPIEWRSPPSPKGHLGTNDAPTDTLSIPLRLYEKAARLEHLSDNEKSLVSDLPEGWIEQQCTL